MQKIYSYNTKSKALHIEGFCKNDNGYEYKHFNSASEAISFSGGQIFLCKDCERERDRILREAIQAKKASNK